MPEQKSFWRKHEFLIIAAATLFFIYIFVVFNQKINFLLGNELIIHLTTSQKSFKMHYGDTSKVEFNISIENVAYCKAVCSYSFNDRSTSDILDNGDFEIKKGQQFARRYDLTVKHLGSGQYIYSFDVKCNSVRSFFCLTKSAEKSRASLIVVDYDLTETEKELKKALKQNVTQLLELLASVDVSHQELNQKYYELAHKINLNKLSKSRIGVNDAYDKLRISIENLKAVWSVENYVKLSRLLNESFFENLSSVKKSIEDINKSFDSTANLHNSILSELNALNKELYELNIFTVLLGNDEFLDSLNSSMENFAATAASLNENRFDEYSQIKESVANISRNQKSLSEKSRIASSALFFNLNYFLSFEKDLLCKLKGECNKESQIENIAKSTEEFMQIYPNASSLIKSCELLKLLTQTYLITNEDALMSIKNNNISFPSSDEFFALANTLKENEFRKINNSYYGMFEKLIAENNTGLDVIKIANLTLPKNRIELMQLAFNKSLNISLHLLSRISPSDKMNEMLDKCAKIDKFQGKTTNFDFQPVSINITFSHISRIDTTLSDNPPICCVFNDCKSCCRDDSCVKDPKTFPIIMLHGHSPSRDNSPEFSLDTFNKLQLRLQEDGYLSAGTVSLYSQNEPAQEGIWGKSGKPVTVKASYYYDAFREEDKYIIIPTKSENIDTYALRLKDLIDTVKQRTSKPKVHIIAHSMGGLVARRYIQIFGEDDIDKLIMIAVPNKGISGSIGEYCGLIGENRECQDMHENSLFINKLNDPLRQPAKIRKYILFGEGCPMKMGNGDGVVLSEKAKLTDGKTFQVNGTCPGFGRLLHTEILDIDKYPEVYNIIKEILIE
ncbi:MAG: alpha/beta fold hydrolase [Nanoarchaeota archaeon]